MIKSPLIKGVIGAVAIALLLGGLNSTIKPTKKSLGMSVQPVQTVEGQNYCSSSQISYGGKTFTLTNAHCCAARPILKANDKYAVSIEGELKEILFVSETEDLCIVEPTGKPTINVAKGETHEGDEIYMMGYPYGQGPEFVSGTVEIKYEIIMVGFLNFYVVDRISMMSFPGNSGSAVVNKYGDLVGLLFAGSTVYPFKGAIVPLKKIRQELDIYVGR